MPLLHRAEERVEVGRPTWWVAALLLAFCLSLTLLSGEAASPTDRHADEYQIKAAYLFNFLHFIHWPTTAAGGPTLIIGIVGKDPFKTRFAPVEGQPVGAGGPRLQIHRYGSYREGMALSGCQLLYICSSERAFMPDIVASVTGSPVLTVSDAEGFVASGGMIQLVERAGRVRWLINRTALATAALRARAQLLRNAAEVIGSPPPTNRVDAARLSPPRGADQ
jgi:hypothetical protein